MEQTRAALGPAVLGALGAVLLTQRHGPAGSASMLCRLEKQLPPAARLQSCRQKAKSTILCCLLTQPMANLHLMRFTKPLGSPPAASKYYFCTNRPMLVRRRKPLEALAEGHIADVLAAAAGFAFR